jgi:hypothetical protein
MYLSLETLPLLVLELICEYLYDDDRGRHSLFAFSSVSRRCCTVTIRERFKHIQIIIQDEGDIVRTLDRWNEILGVERQRHVRHMTVRRHAQSDEDDIDIANEEEIYGKPLVALGIFGGLTEYAYPTSEESQRQNESYLPLSHFIRKLPGLRDLTWAAAGQVPSTVLAAVEHQHIRLHDYTFCLPSLIQPRETVQDINADELALATSPSLYSIAAPHVRFNTEGHINRNPDALLQMVAGLAPSLRNLTLFGTVPGNSLSLMRSVRLPIPPWQGLSKDLDTRELQITATGQLAKLSLGGILMATSQIVEKWSKHTDFSLLEMLELRANLDGLRTLYEMATSKTFTNLQRLSLHVFPHIHQEEGDIDGVAAKFLLSLYPLESLRLRGFAADRSFCALLESHGPALRKLQFIPSRSGNLEVEYYSFSSENLHKLSRHCPNLEEAELLIDRTKGDAKEVQIYRALSTIRKLKRISLGLDCSSRREFTANDDEDAERQKEARMRDWLINSAIDSTLAVSIFEIISNKSSTLQVLKLFVEPFVDNGPENEDISFLDIFNWIRRSWFCCRDPSNAEKRTVRELKKNARIESGTRIPDHLNDFHHREPFARVWRELWPGAGVNWKEEWKSFPLAPC